MLPVFYSFRRCPYAMRARLALAASGFEVELREILLRDKPQAFLEASPSATVPAMILEDGRALDESLDIMLHALRSHDPESWLEPGHGSLNDMLALIADADGDFKRNLDRAKYATRYPATDPQAAWNAAMDYLEGLSKTLEGRGGCLFGERPYLADMAILPFVRQFAHIDKPRFDAAAPPQLADWLARFLASDLLQSVMDKYPVWRPGERGMAFPVSSPG
jgi:glutathione S-transferase